MLSKILVIMELVLSIVLIVTILLQQKGGGLGAAFGGSSNVYSTKRGMDKVLYQITIVVAILFLLISLANLLV